MKLESVPKSYVTTGTKSVWIAYLLWLFGGFLGLHHFYLGRDRHGFVIWCTLGGYCGLMWLSDVFRVPEYVRDANDDPRFIEPFIEKLRKNAKPPFATNRFIASVVVSYLWGQLVMLAVPEEEFMGINWKSLYWLIPLAVALGVWTVGNIGREKGTIWWALAAAYATYPVRYWVYDETVWFSLMCVCSAFAFDHFSKQWRREPPKKRGFCKRITTISFCITLYLSLWGCYFYFNGKITDSAGDEVPVHEAIRHFFTSPWWTDLKTSLYDTYQYGQHHGWYETWKQVIDLLDADGEQNAYRVLGVSPTSSQSEITTTWRKLSREFHPDKVKDPNKQREAQERFMEIQQAYEILSSIKNKRNSRNRKSNSG